MKATSSRPCAALLCCGSHAPHAQAQVDRATPDGNGEGLARRRDARAATVTGPTWPPRRPGHDERGSGTYLS